VEVRIGVTHANRELTFESNESADDMQTAITDALASDAVSTIDIPPEADVTASYAGVVVGASAHQDEARAFLDWLNAPAAQAILASFGFAPPP